MHKRFSVVVARALLLSAGLVGVSSAALGSPYDGLIGDAEVFYPGSFCKAKDFQVNDVYGKFSNQNWTGLLNDSEEEHSFTCPLVRRVPFGKNSNGTQTFHSVRMYLSNVANVANCALRMTTWDGTTDYVHPSPDITPSFDNQTLLADFGSGQVWDFASMVVTCDLWPGQAINSYAFEEASVL